MNRRQFTRNILLGAGELSLLGAAQNLFAAGEKPRALSVTVGKTVVITSTHERCWFPGMHRFPNGDLLIEVSKHADTVAPQEGMREAYLISRDGGATWSERISIDTSRGVWSDTPGPDGGIWGMSGHTVSQTTDQDLVFARTDFPRPGKVLTPTGLAVRQRQDIRLHLNEPAQGVMFTGTVMHTRDSNLIAGIYVRSKGAKFYHVSAAHSADKGDTWNEGTVIAEVKPEDAPWPGMGKDGPCEPALVRLHDKRLFVIYRTGSDGFLGSAWSSDEGKTWTPPKLLTIKGVMPRIHLLSNGVLALSTGRPGPVTMYFNLDGTGESWTNDTPIFKDMSTRYTEFVELEPGKLFLVYDSVPYGWKEIPAADTTSQNVIYGTYIDVKLTS